MSELLEKLLSFSGGFVVCATVVMFFGHWDRK